MKLLITGDWQLDSSPAHDQVDQETGRSARFSENVKIIEDMIDAAAEAGADGLLHLGDLTENKNPKAVELDAAASLFTRAMNKGMRIWAIAGNHDGSLFKVSSSSFSPLAKMRGKDFKLFHDIDYDPELGMLAIPYQHRLTPSEIHDLVTPALDRYDKETPGKRIFVAMHYGVQGCTVGPRNLVLQTDYLNAADFMHRDEIDSIFCGHIHKAQTVDVAGAKAYFPGSPVICDFGERDDRKTFILYDTESYRVEIIDTIQPRRWLSLPYDLELFKKDECPWSSEDLVKFTGTYMKPDYPKDTIEEMIAGGWPRPFSITFETKPVRDEKVVRSKIITAEGGMREALQTYVREKYKNSSEQPGTIGPATQLALDLLYEQGLKHYADQVIPERMELSQFMTVAQYERDFKMGTPTLITGPNGIGKTNFIDGPLWIITGQTSKGLGLAAIVRQGQDSAKGMIELRGVLAGQEDVLYRIEREVKLSKKGKPKQSLEFMKNTGEKWEPLHDGGIAETQAEIDALVGGSYTTLRTTAFKFQNDRSPFIMAHPSNRKAVIGEISGQEPLAKAFKKLDERRKESNRVLEQLKDQLEGVAAASEGAAERRAEAEQKLGEGTLELRGAENLKQAALKNEADALENQKNSKSAVELAEKMLEALPNTEADLQAAEAAKKSFVEQYEKDRQEKIKKFTTLKAGIAEKSKSLAALQIPSLDQMEAARKAFEAAKDESDAMSRSVNQLEIEGAAAAGQLKPAQDTLAESKSLLEKTQSSLKSLGAAEDVLAMEKKADEYAAQLKQSEEKSQQTAAEVTEATAKASAAKQSAETASEARQAMEGQEEGACSRCRQPVTAEHLKKEIEDLDTVVFKTKADQEAALQALGKAQQENAASLAAVAIAQEKLDSFKEVMRSAITKNEKIKDMKTQIEKTEASISDQTAKVESLDRDAKNIDEKITLSKGRAQAAQEKASSMEKNFNDQKEITASAESLRGELKALQQQDQDNTAAGIREKKRFEQQSLQHDGKIVLAKEAHQKNSAESQSLRKELERLRSESEKVSDSVSDARASLEKAKGLAATIEERMVGHRNLIEELDRSAETAKQLGVQIKAAEEKAEVDTTACQLLDPKQGLPVYLIDAALPFLEDRINSYMVQLGMDRLTVELTTLDGDKETLAVMVDNGRPGPRLEIAAFSGGQLDRVEYAIKCAMSDLARQTRGVTLGLACYDEPTGGLDSHGKESLIQMLFQRCETYPVTLVVSHDEALIRSFDHKLLFSQGASDETMVA